MLCCFSLKKIPLRIVCGHLVFGRHWRHISVKRENYAFTIDVCVEMNKARVPFKITALTTIPRNMWLKYIKGFIAF